MIRYLLAPFVLLWALVVLAGLGMGLVFWTFALGCGLSKALVDSYARSFKRWWTKTDEDADPWTKHQRARSERHAARVSARVKARKRRVDP